VATQDILSGISRRVMLAVGAAFIVIVLLAAAIAVAVQRSEAVTRAEWQLASAAAMLGQQVQQSVRSVDLIIGETIKDIEANHAHVRSFTERELFENMSERARALPYVRNLIYVDGAGQLKLESREFPAASIHLGDREYYRVHRERATGRLHVGEPVIGRITKEQVQPFSRRVNAADGTFLGVVVATMRTPHVEGILGSLKLAPGARVALYRDDGILLAAHPPVESIGRSFAGDSLFGGARTPAASEIRRRQGLLDAEARLFAVERLKAHSLVLTVAFTESVVFSEWRQNASRIGVGAIAIAVFIGIALFLLLQQVRVSAGLASELHMTGERLKSIIDSAMDAIITVDGNQNIVMFNAAAEKIFRCSAAEALGGPLDRFVPERFRAVHREHIERFGRTSMTTRMMGARLALSGLRADGEEFPIDASISQAMLDGGRFYTVILRDITARKRAEDAVERSHEELRELSAAMHEVREAERLRVARELHDELAQWLTALKMDIAWVSSRLPPEHALLHARADRMKGLVDTTVAAVRRIAADLRPVMLDDLGLVPALEHLLHDLSQRTGIVVSLDAEETAVDFGEPLASALYRIAQEALTNVARHAGATEVEVTITSDDDRLVLAVRDNGKGYDAELAARRKSYGVLGIRERARTLGGEARIERLTAGGTLVEVVIPMARYRRREAAA
jgi:PAS domain S-box-containing protein